MKVPHLLFALLFSMLAVSCKSTQNSEYEDPYVSNFGNDGNYNPYPDGGGYSQPSYSAPSTPSYEAPPSDPYAFSSSSSSTPSSSSYSPPKTSTSSKPKTSTVKKSSSRTHTVVRGDTLYGLARKYGSSVSKIKSANGLSGDLIRIGQRLKIP
jgi:nucleoid-associated protein YgaU